MKPRHQVSRAGVALIKRFEGLRTRAAALEDGRWTIGYGHTKTARRDAAVSEADAEALLLYDLINVAHAVNEWTHAPLNQNQFDALTSFAFNIGLENFRRSTTLRRVNEGRMLEAALAMELWRKADFEGERIIIDALVRRRAYEVTLFLKPADAFAPAPSPVLPPKLDTDGMLLLPASQPQAVRGVLEGELAIARRDAPLALIPVEDSGPTASEVAAAAVTARLEAILPDAAFPADTTTPSLAPEPAADLPFPAEAEEATRDIDVASPAAETPAESADAKAPAEAKTPDEAALTLTKPATRAGRESSPLVLLGLGFLGVALLFAAATWGFRSSVTGGDALTAAILGWGLGGIGILSIVAAAYLLLSRLDNRDGDAGAA